MAFWNTRGIRRRWMLNNLGMVTLVLLTMVAAFTFVLATNYYSSLRNSMQTRASVDAYSLSMYGTRSEYITAAKDYVESFSDSARMELQYVSNNGKVVSSSYSLTIAGSDATTSDIVTAQERGEIAYWMGKDLQTGERILPVPVPLLYHGDLSGVLRYVISLRLSYRQPVSGRGSALALVVDLLPFLPNPTHSFLRPRSRLSL